MKRQGWFVLKLELGNAAMETTPDVARALRAVAHRVEVGEDEGRIMDVNGNTVGRFAFEKEA